MITLTKWNERGEMNALLLSTILLAVFFVAAASFAAWAFSSRQDYKNNVEAKISTAVAANKQVVQTADAAQYAIAAKNPLKTYVGPDAYGAVHISYPKTWSAYIDTTDGTPLNAYFHTDYVPSTSDSTASYNLRVQVVTTSYADVLNQYSGEIQQGTVTATPYSLPKVPSVVGTRLDGQVVNNTGSGSVVLLPVRNETLELSIQSPAYASDFNTYILPNLSFSP